MTTIKSQLARLSSEKATKENRIFPSILYSIKQAGSQDLDQIYFGAVKGLSLLVQIDNRFNQFKETIMSIEYKGMAREILSQQENDKLDEKLKEILLLLSSFFLYDGALRVIEYLLRNFLVHQYLPREIVLYFLQYHSTPLYTRFVQNLVDNHREQQTKNIYIQKIKEMICYVFSIILLVEVRSQPRIQQLDNSVMTVDYQKDSQNFQLKKQIQQTTKCNRNILLISLVEDLINSLLKKQPNNLTFLFEILHSLNQNTNLSEQFLDLQRPSLGKLVGILVEFPTNERLSFAYFALALRLTGMKYSWFTESQISLIAKYVFSNLNQLKTYPVTLQLVDIFFYLEQHPLSLEHYVEFYSLLEEANKSPSIPNVLSTVKYITSQKINNLSEKFQTYLISQIAQLLKSQGFFQETLLELVLNHKNQLAQKISELIKVSCQDQRLLKKYFNNENISNLNSQSIYTYKWKNLQELTIHQIVQMTYEIQRILVENPNSLVPAIKLLEKCFTVSQQKSKDVQIMDLIRFNDLLAALEPFQNNKIYQLLYEIYGKLQNTTTNDELKLESLLRICCVANKGLKETVNQIKSIESFDWVDEILESFENNLIQFLQNKITTQDPKLLLQVFYIIILESQPENIDEYFKLIQKFIQYNQAYDWNNSLDFIQRVIEKFLSSHQENLFHFLLSLGSVGCKEIIQLIKHKPQLLNVLFNLIFKSKKLPQFSTTNAFSIISYIQQGFELEHQLNQHISQFIFFAQLVFYQFNQVYQKIFQQLVQQLKQLSKEQTKIPIIYENKTILIERKLLKQTLFSLLKDKSNVIFTKSTYISSFNQEKTRCLLETILIFINNMKILQGFNTQKQIIIEALENISDILLAQKQGQKGKEILSSLIKIFQQDKSLISVIQSPLFRFIGLQNEQLEIQKQILQIPITIDSQSIFESKFFTLLNEQLQSYLLIQYGRSKLQKKFNPEPTFDLQAILNHFILLIQNQDTLIEEIDYHTNLIIIKIKSLSIESIQLLLSVNNKQAFTIPFVLQIVNSYIQQSQNIEVPLHDLVRVKINEYESKEKLDLSEPITYQTYLNFFNILGMLMQSKFKKPTYQCVIQYIENQIKAQIDQPQLLILIEIIMKSLNRTAQKFVHQTRFVFFLTAIVVSQQNTSDKNKNLHSQMFKLLQYFHEDELWLILYVQSKFEFPNEYNQLFLNFLKTYSNSVKLQWSMALSESVTFNQAKDSRRRKFKGLPIQVEIKNKPFKYKTNLLKKILGKIESTVKFFKTNYKPSGDFKQNSLKKYIATSLQYVKLVTNELVQSDIDEIKQQKLFIQILISLQRVEKWYSSSKLGNFALSTKNDFLSKIKLIKLMTLLTNFNDSNSVTKLILKAIIGFLKKPSFKVSKKDIPMIVQFIQSGFDQFTDSNKVKVYLSYLEGLIAVFNQQHIRDVISSDYFQNPEGIYTNLQNLLDVPQLRDKKHIILTLMVDSSYLFKSLIIQNISFVSRKISELLASLNSQEHPKYEEQTLGEKYKTLLKIDQGRSFKESFQHTITSFIEFYCRYISKNDLIVLFTLIVANNDEASIQMFIGKVETRILLQIIPEIINISTQISYQTTANLVKSMNQLVSILDEDSVSLNYQDFTQWIIQLLNYPRMKFIEQEIDGTIYETDRLENEIIQVKKNITYFLQKVFLGLVVKMNDNQLKKSFNQLIQFAKQQSNGYNFANYNRLVFFKFMFKLSNNLGSLFTKYFGYFFDSIITSFEQFHQAFNSSKKQQLQKRTIQECDTYYKLLILQCRHTLQCVEQMCANDKDEFFDTERFEKLAQPLALVLDCPKVNYYEKLQDFLCEWANSAIVTVFQQVNDEFKWKNQCYYILQVLQKHSKKDSQESLSICITIIKLIDKLVDIFNDRFTVLVNDIVPYIYNLNSLNLDSEELNNLISNLITKFSNICGEDIQNVMKSQKRK